LPVSRLLAGIAAVLFCSVTGLHLDGARALLACG